MLIDEMQEGLGELKAVLDSASAHTEYESRELLSSVLGILKIHDRTTSDAGKKTIGIKNLIGVLEQMDPSEYLVKIHIRSEDWAGYCVLSPDQSHLLGCALVRRVKGAAKQTPPNWDGSREMLERFDKNNLE